MDEADEHEERQPPDEQRRAAGVGRQMIVLDREADAEQQREKREGLQVDADHQDRIERAIQPAVVRPNWQIAHGQEAFEDRDPEDGDDIDRHDAEQGDTPDDVDRGDAIGRGDRTGGRARRCRNPRSASTGRA